MNLCIFCLFSFVYGFYFFGAEYLGYLMIMLWFGSVKFCFWILRKLIIFFNFFEKNVVSYVDALPLLCYAGASCC